MPIPENLESYFRNIPPESEYAFFRAVQIGKKTIYRQLTDFHTTWNRACKKAGITGFRFHDLRRVSATNLANRNVSESLIRKIGGWKTDIFIRRYRHIGLNDMYNAVNSPLDKTQVSTLVSTIAG
ncbi:MAG: tyrosine-type recombinase/integrase [Fibrobacterota bacterium]